MKNIIKYVVLSLSSIVCAFLMVLLVAFLHDVNELNQPITMFLPCVAIVAMVVALILFTTWCFKYKKEQPYKSLGIFSLGLFVASIVMFFVLSPMINSRIPDTKIPDTETVSLGLNEVTIPIDYNGNTEYRNYDWGMSMEDVKKFAEIDGFVLTEETEDTLCYDITDEEDPIYKISSVTDEVASNLFYFKDGKLVKISSITVPYATKEMYNSLHDELASHWEITVDNEVWGNSARQEIGINTVFNANDSEITLIYDGGINMLDISYMKKGYSEASEADEEKVAEEKVVEKEKVVEEEKAVEEKEAVQKPLIYTGTGDSVIEIGPLEKIYTFYIEGNQAGRHFAVKGYDVNGNLTELFVNTTEPYKGVTIDMSLETTTLEITGTGEWKIELQTLSSIKTISTGETVSGNGDSVLLILSSGKTATIAGNDAERHFAIKSYGKGQDNLMVNAVDKYSGTVMLEGAPLLLEINAVGNWEITFN